MWTKAHRARHEAGLKQKVSLCAVTEMPRSRRATPIVAVVGAIVWHLRVGGSWRGVVAGIGKLALLAG